MASIKFDNLPYDPLRITSPFGPRNTGIAGASRNHLGVDMGTDKSKYKGNTDGGPIKAVLPYTVNSSYYNKYRGWVVLLDHGNGIQTLYQHLKERGVAKGTSGEAGDVIGTMGNTGTGAQLHLHFELRVNGVPIDPEPYLIKAEEEEVEIEKAKLSLNGKLTELDAIFYEGHYYFGIREVADADKNDKLTVGYDAKTKTVIINSK